ncbi:uncharacterized protein LOC133326674 [Musca vetustissima]|uniref:uncharacterized protein LOC133326674 n=1 Tax=Musca vetustissima TaxID=27455 RepID=UPI002AB70C87|nr:uncharacterized protein LOC133326674 [Musca vetustissima]
MLQAERSRRRRNSISYEERQEETARQIARRNQLKFQRYNDAIKQGPTRICTCCGGLWFPHQVESLHKEDIPSPLKDLTSVEERLVTARLPFMIIVALGFERQSAIRGAVVNVPISVSETVTSLPRNFDQAQVIQLHLKRRMAYQHDYMTETIRPAKVIDAARYLINTELYIKHGITIDESWFEGCNSSLVVPFVANQEDREEIQNIFENQLSTEATVDDIQHVEEYAMENLNPGGQQTMLECRAVENVPHQRVVMAPGEGRRPIDMIMDTDSEELAFVSIYCGKKRSCTETYSKIVRSELRRYDRRCCRVDKILYSYKKLELLTIKSAMSIALRKHTRSGNVTARNALDESYMNSLIQHDDGYRILKGVRTSPAHWEGEKKKAVAMIRQFGLPTFFITLSAAETKWVELLVILSKTVDKIDISEEDASNLSFADKARLIRSDAITCSRYFDFRFRQLFSLFKMNGGIFDNHFVEKYYWRVEFQQRGSPHIHGMYWLKDAPKIDLNNSSSFSSVITFIDKYISTDGSDGNLQEFISYQRHNHNRSCIREFRGEKICRILRDAVDEIRAGNYSIKQKLQHIAHKFISGTEISAQEATYCCLGMRLSESSNAEVYINTGRPEERVFILRPREQLLNLPPDSSDIYAVGILEHYIQRPDELEDLCLADFAANYKYSRTRRNNASTGDYEEHDDHEENSEQTLRIFQLKDNSGFIQEKVKPHVIRYRRYNVNTHKSDYFRELMMLFYPWRNEDVDLLQNDNEASCNAFKERIELNRKKYDVFEDRELENVLQRLRDEERIEDITEEEEIRNVDDEFRVLGVPDIDPNVNILHTQGDGTSNENSEASIRIIKLPPLMSDSDLLNMVRTLNTKQKLYLTHLSHNIKCGSTFYEFVGGGAGVGKSRLISAIYQTVNRRLNTIPGSDPTSIKVLLTAPTGKAAFGIGGATLHSMFSLPVNQSNSELRPLGPDALNSIYTKLMNLRLLIIDEVSMVGAKMFSYLDARLKQIFKSSEYFGGISVLVFGDLMQLSPVGDRWIFAAPTTDPYGTIYGTSTWDKFKYFELTEIMRQREDRSFAIALNNMASGQMTNDDVSLLRQRIVSPAAVPDEAIHLFCSNDEVNIFNTLKLSSIPTEEVLSTACDFVKSTGLTDENRNRIMESVKTFKVSETQGLPYQLILKTTAKYMVTVNIDTSDGLVNGATGQLMEIDFIGTTRKPSTLWMKFPQENTGVLARSKKRHPSESLWTPIDVCVKTFQFKRNEHVNIDLK